MLIHSGSGDKVVFNVTPTALSWIGSGLILASAMWIAAAKDTDKPHQKPHQEWAKEDLAFGGGEGAARLMHAEGSTSKGEGGLSEEREGLMNRSDSHENNNRRDPGPAESIEMGEFDPDEIDAVNHDQNGDSGKHQDLL
jgi:hypothetical protein